MDLIEFMRARLDEDEAVIRDDAGLGLAYDWPARLLAEVDAKRRVIDVLELARDAAFPADAWVLAREVVRELVQPYRDHPEFDPSWLVSESCRQRWVMGAEERG